MTGSITCFHIASIVACSSFDFATKDTKPPRPGVVLDRGRNAPKSDPEGDRSSVNVPPSADRTAEAGASKGGNVFWGIKKVEIKLYSAVALSKKTKSSDLRSASM